MADAFAHLHVKYPKFSFDMDKLEERRPEPEQLISNVLDRTIDQLEYLRSAIERAQRKDIRDVRDFGETSASSLFIGVEERITYYDLIKLISKMRQGMSQRRLQLGH